MKNIKDELQYIIISNGQVGSKSQLKEIQNFLRRNAEASLRIEKHKYLKSEEEINLIAFAHKEGLFYQSEIFEKDYISAGAEQKVYRYDDFHIIKLHDSIFLRILGGLF